MKKERRDEGAFSKLLPVAGLMVIGYTIAAVKLGLGFAIPGFVMLIGGGVGFLFTPLGRALTRSVEAEAGLEPPQLPGELLAELDELRARVAELEERQDFSERMLASESHPLPIRSGRGSTP